MNHGRIRRPEWLKVRLESGENAALVRALVSDLSLHTVCQEARCPNIYECFARKTATFMICGGTCSRRCGFCSVETGSPLPLDPEEPGNTARAVEALGLDYAVVTSVTRDDLPDGGSLQFARTVDAVRDRVPRCTVELLIPDFQGSAVLLDNVLHARPDVLGHNIETVPYLYPRVRPAADYARSLRVLERAAAYRDERFPALRVKSGVMAGLGETSAQILQTMRDIRATGCDLMTIGQYLAPLKSSLPVERFYTPEEFREFARAGLEMGFTHVESGPLVRSSYRAKEQAERAPRT
jgi:lipoic acid synthetase